MPDAPHADPFDLLGLPATFDLDRARVERAYLARAAAAHPDHARPDAVAQSGAHAASADLNRAARTLRDPESRAIALLHRLGGPASPDDRSLPDGFLQSILETRLEIEQAIGDPAARAGWERWAQDQRARYTSECSRLFGALAKPPAPESLRLIRRTLNAWRYIERLIEQLDPDYDPARADLAP